MSSLAHMPEKQGQRTILLVEDHQDLAETVGAFLESQGYTVDYASDGLTAMHLAVTEEYDAIVLDIGLPGIDGLEVCRRLRQNSDVPIIFLTALGDVENVVQGLELGGDDYMVKPFEEAIKRMSHGSISSVVKTQFGYHIIKKTGQKE